MRYYCDMILEMKMKNGRRGEAFMWPLFCVVLFLLLLSQVRERNGVVKRILTHDSRNSAGAEAWTHSDPLLSNSSRVRGGWPSRQARA